MFCYKCGKKIPSESVFCLHCGARQNAASTSVEKAPIVPAPNEPSNFGFAIISSEFDNKHYANSSDIPEWVRKFLYPKEHGVVVWDCETQKTETLFAFEALDLLDDCQSSASWKEEGIPICTSASRVNLPSVYSKKARASKEKKATDSSEEKKTEVLRIRGKDAELFIQALEDRKKFLERMSEEDDRKTSMVLRQCYKILFDGMHRQEEIKVDLTKRQLSWQHESEFYWNCEASDFIGIVSLGEHHRDLPADPQPRKSRRSAPPSFSISPDPLPLRSVKLDLWWIGQVKSAKRNYFNLERFISLEEALDWVEKEIVSLKDQPFSEDRPKPQEPDEFVLTEELRQKLAPYWIDPASLEPEKITYQSVINLFREPVSSEWMTLLSGRQMEINRKYPSAAALAVELGLDDSAIDFEQPVPDSDWYQVTSLTKFYSAQAAIDYSQSLWVKSGILKMFKEGKIRSASYGYKEAETGYFVTLGECSAEDQPLYKKNSSRSEYLAWQALRYTLINALDISSYRSLMLLPVDYFSNELLLRKLHQFRTECHYVPADASAESMKWLRAHPERAVPDKG